MRLAQRTDKSTSTFVLFNLIDYVLTVGPSDVARGCEGNPLMGESILSIGVTKLSATTLTTMLRPYQSRIIKLLNAGLCAVVLWNIFTILIL